MQNVFQIEKTTLLENGQIYIIGRVLEGIKSGDVLYKRESEYMKGEGFAEDKNIDPNLFSRMEAFTVLNIVMYGHSVDDVSRGYTAGIYLQGQAQLVDAKALAKRDDVEL